MFRNQKEWFEDIDKSFCSGAQPYVGESMSEEDGDRKKKDDNDKDNENGNPSGGSGLREGSIYKTNSEQILFKEFLSGVEDPAGIPPIMDTGGAAGESASVKGGGGVRDRNITASSTSRDRMIKLMEKTIEEEFPRKPQIPSGRDLVNVGKLMHNRSLYSPGDWVEIEGLDMKWRLDMITRVVRKAPEDYDWNNRSNQDKEPNWIYTYNAGSNRDVDEWDLRTPQGGLQVVFGKRPWVWQQYAILRLEKKLRFQKGHQDDFMELDIQKFAVDLWAKWLDHPSNVDFKNLYNDKRVGEKGRMLLLSHITKPFNLVDIMGEKNKEWEFTEDDNINVFTYLSLHGSGAVLPLLVLGVQIVIPILLVIETGRNQNKCVAGEDIEAETVLAKIMAAVVFIYYMFSIIPETYANFFNVAGAADTVYSRLLSLRKILWLQNDDTYLQMIGYRLDIYINTSYETLLSMINIYVLLNTNEAIEIILNALAFTFIARIDEDLTKSYWYDPESRWLTAGAMSTVMQSTINLRWLESSKLFGEQFDIPEKTLIDIVSSDENFLFNHDCAKIDSADEKYMSNTEKIESMCIGIAKQNNNLNARKEYEKPKMFFGVIERIPWLRGQPVFEKFISYRTWSRWEKVLFLSPVPDLNSVFDEDGEGIVNLSINLDRMKPNLINFYPDEDDTDEWILFLRQFWNVLIFKEMMEAIKPALVTKHYLSALFRAVDGIFFNWTSYFIHIIFPVYLSIALLDTVYMISTRSCFNVVDAIEEFLNKIFSK